MSTPVSMRTCVALCAIALWGAGCGSRSMTAPTESSIESSTVSKVMLSGNVSLAAGQTSQLAATATLSNGVTQVVTELAAWQSSNTSVAIVSATGLVTAVNNGAATITATYKAVAGTFSMTTFRLPTGPPWVRTLYLAPADREFRSDFSTAIGTALTSMQLWYREQLGDRTFSLSSTQPERCRLTQPASYFLSDTWNKVMSEVQRCAPVGYFSTQTTWVLYVDAEHTCNAPGRLGAATSGVAILPRMDLVGLAGGRSLDDCGGDVTRPVNRWIGGLGHELGHAFYLPHPPGCDAGAPSCDSAALMWAGYASYPNTYLRDDEKAVLRTSVFLR